MSDDSQWIFTSPGGHPANGVTLNSTFYMSPLADSSGLATVAVVPTFSESHLFTWGNPFIVDGNRLYTLGPANHPTVAADEWLGTYVMAYTVGSQGMVNGDVPDFVYSNLDTFIAKESDEHAGQKPWCAGISDIYLVSAVATHDSSSTSVNYSHPLRLTGIDKVSGGQAWELPLSISALGSDERSFMPQIAYADRLATDGVEYVAMMLPEASISPFPYDTSAVGKSRISVVNATARTEIWTYSYNRNETTPVMAFSRQYEHENVNIGRRPVRCLR